MSKKSAKADKKHGGKREGAGRPKKKNARIIPTPGKVSQEVAQFLRDAGTHLVEEILRRSKDFREWRKK